MGGEVKWSVAQKSFGCSPSDEGGRDKDLSICVEDADDGEPFARSHEGVLALPKAAHINPDGRYRWGCGHDIPFDNHIDGQDGRWVHTKH